MDKTSLYRAVWRWHFYAGLIVLPILLWMAVTGAIYLYKPEIDAWTMRDYSQVLVTGNPVPVSTMIRNAQQITGGKVTQVVKPATPGESWRMSIEAGDFRRMVFMNPNDGTLIGMMEEGGITRTVRRLHSLAITGPVGNAVVEIVAGWTIVLVLTGFYLWWPRLGQKAIALRGRPAGRLFWRDLHASTGAIVGLVILFLAVTGMPWSQTWGRGLQIVIAANDLGRPKAPGPMPWEGKKAAAGPEVKQALPWSLQEAGVPQGKKDDIGPDKAVAIATAAGLSGGYTMILPGAPQSPYLFATATVQAQDARALFLDAGTGKILQDSRYADFGPGAKAFEWGIATHEGRQYGEVNRLVMLAGALSIILLAITAPMLWWKRRVDGRLGAPPTPDRKGAARGVAAIMLTVGLIYPLTGLTMVVALLGEGIARRGRRRLGLSQP